MPPVRDVLVGGADQLAALERVEALLRCRGLIPSAEFIAVAEGSGLIVSDDGFRSAPANRRRPGAGRASRAPGITVNLSARQFRHDALVAGIREALTKSGLDPADLDLEITESSFMHDTLRAGQVLEDIDALGVLRA